MTKSMRNVSRLFSLPTRTGVVALHPGECMRYVVMAMRSEIEFYRVPSNDVSDHQIGYDEGAVSVLKMQNHNCS